MSPRFYFKITRNLRISIDFPWISHIFHGFPMAFPMGFSISPGKPSPSLTPNRRAQGGLWDHLLTSHRRRRLLARRRFRVERRVFGKRRASKKGGDEEQKMGIEW